MKRDPQPPDAQPGFPTSSFVIKNYEGQVALQNYTAAIAAEVYGTEPPRPTSIPQRDGVTLDKKPGNG